jgi:hypothetical protein
MPRKLYELNEDGVAARFPRKFELIKRKEKLEQMIAEERRLHDIKMKSNYKELHIIEKLLSEHKQNQLD